MGFGCPKTEEGEGHRTENDRVKGLEKKTKRKEQKQKTNKRKWSETKLKYYEVLCLQHRADLYPNQNKQNAAKKFEDKNRKILLHPKALKNVIFTRNESNT